MGFGFESRAAHRAPLAQRTELPPSKRMVGGSRPSWRTRVAHLRRAPWDRVLALVPPPAVGEAAGLCPCRAVRSARHPLKVETVGSNPTRDTPERRHSGRKVARDLIARFRPALGSLALTPEGRHAPID